MPELLLIILAVGAASIVEWGVLYLLLDMLRSVGAVSKNYQNIDIPVSAGISFPMAILVVFIIYKLVGVFQDDYHILAVGIIAISMLGFIDDMLGKRDTLGFKGHFGALLKGRLTTGGLKALGGGLLAFYLALFVSAGVINVIINSLIIALFTNMLNLLDLRPGRAVKGFALFFLAIIALSLARIDWLLVAPVLGSLIIYSPVDLKARAMMGDAGSNVLGLILGYLCSVNLGLAMRLGVLLFLIFMHVFTEKYSLTTIIEQNHMLRSFDRLGRPEYRVKGDIRSDDKQGTAD